MNKYLPDDDSAVYAGRVEVLNRIDQEYGCDEIIDMDRNFPYGNLEPVYCGLPEHDPFTNRCYHHGVSGHLPGGSI